VPTSTFVFQDHDAIANLGNIGEEIHEDLPSRVPV
jgi:hypothetical protein